MHMKTRLGTAVLALACALAGASFSPAVLARQDPARQLQESKREAWQRVPDILAAVGAQPGARIADVGAGDGFFTVRLAGAVGQAGHVTAVDISTGALDRLRRRLTAEAISNVDVVQSDAADVHLPAASFDGILIVIAYHEIERYQQALARFREALKPDGRLVIVDPLDPKLRLEPRDRQTSKHSLAAPFAVGEVRTAGFEITGLQDPFTHEGSTEQWMLVARRPQ
jgi:ubiquinone/menaquinone biosynthesis C-methylase UbiE